jgi:ADP-ribose pyrophosphatase YjhB (NUDIX family)
MDEQYKRLVQTAVTCFVYNGDDYLFLKRSMNKKVDAGRLNGVGGRVEHGENFLDAAIREVEEETGYKVALTDLRLCGVIKEEGGYAEDWIMCLFKINVADKNIPIGNSTNDGELLWINKKNILSSGYDLVDNINYCMQNIIDEDGIFFINAQFDENEKIKGIKKGILSNGSLKNDVYQ